MFRAGRRAIACRSNPWFLTGHRHTVTLTVCLSVCLPVYLSVCLRQAAFGGKDSWVETKWTAKPFREKPSRETGTAPHVCVCSVLCQYRLARFVSIGRQYCKPTSYRYCDSVCFQVSGVLTSPHHIATVIQSASKSRVFSQLLRYCVPVSINVDMMEQVGTQRHQRTVKQPAYGAMPAHGMAAQLLLRHRIARWQTSRQVQSLNLVCNMSHACTRKATS
jgi:hypothetical protein